MGGMIAQTIAYEHPTRAASLVSIMSTTWAPHLPQPGQEQQQGIADMNESSDEEAERLQAFKENGVTSLNVSFLGTTSNERIENCDKLSNLIAKAL